MSAAMRKICPDFRGTQHEVVQYMQGKLLLHQHRTCLP